jgi:hypothetical protein
VYFFTRGWQPLGSKTKLRAEVSDITKIDEATLIGQAPISSSTIMRRMRWAAGRQTTRTEDIAYCLLGVFDVNMPLLYGEGNKAFYRLQEEIIKKSNDLTILAWGHRPGLPRSIGFLAPSPARFSAEDESEYTDGGPDYIPDELSKTRKTFSMTNLGLEIEVYRFEVDGAHIGSSGLAIVLSCRLSKDLHRLLCIHAEAGAHGRLTRVPYTRPFNIDRLRLAGRESTTEYLLTNDNETRRENRLKIWRAPDQLSLGYNYMFRTLPHGSIKPNDVIPAGAYDTTTRILKFRGGTVIKITAHAYIAFYGQFKATDIIFPLRSGAVVEKKLEAWCNQVHTKESLSNLGKPFSELTSIYPRKYQISINPEPISVNIGREQHNVHIVDIIAVTAPNKT